MERKKTVILNQIPEQYSRIVSNCEIIAWENEPTSYRFKARITFTDGSYLAITESAFSRVTVPVILTTVIFCAFRIFSKTVLQTVFADKTVCKTVLQKAQIMPVGSIIRYTD